MPNNHHKHWVDSIHLLAPFCGHSPHGQLPAGTTPTTPHTQHSALPTPAHATTPLLHSTPAPAPTATWTLPGKMKENKPSVCTVRAYLLDIPTPRAALVSLLPYHTPTPPAMPRRQAPSFPRLHRGLLRFFYCPVWTSRLYTTTERCLARLENPTVVAGATTLRTCWAGFSGKQQTCHL